MAKTFLLGILSSVALATPLNLSASLAPLVENENAIQGEYMIMFKDGHRLGRHEEFLGHVLGTSMRRHWDEVIYLDIISAREKSV